MLNDATSSCNLVAWEITFESEMDQLESVIENPAPTSTDGEKHVEDLRDASGDWIHSDLPMDDPGFVEIVIDFIPQLKSKIDQMHQALDAGDFENLAMLAHWLKGSGGTCGFAQFYPPSLELEKSAVSRHAEASATCLNELVQLSNRIWIPNQTDSFAT